VKITVDWLGTATFRLAIDDLLLFLDAYIDRLPTAPDVGFTERSTPRRTGSRSSSWSKDPKRRRGACAPSP